jgi:hypothetical protein
VANRGTASAALRAQMTSEDKAGLTPFARAAANGNVSGAKALYDWLAEWDGGSLLVDATARPDKLGRQVLLLFGSALAKNRSDRYAAVCLRTFPFLFFTTSSWGTYRRCTCWRGC